MSTQADDSPDRADSIEDWSFNELQSYVANETEFKATGSKEELLKKARTAREDASAADADADASTDADVESEPEPDANDVGDDSADAVDSDDGSEDADDAAEGDGTDEADEAAESGSEEGSDAGYVPAVPEDNRPRAETGTPTEFRASVEAGVLEGFLEKLDVVVDEAKLHVSDGGFRAIAVDPANVSMADVGLSADAFEMLQTDAGVLGLNIERLMDVMDLASAGDLVHLEFDVSTRKFNVSIGDLDATMALIDPDSIRQEPDLPSLNLPMLIKLKGKAIHQGVDAADMVSDHVGFVASETDDALQLTAEGDTDDITRTYARSDSEIVHFEAGEVNSLFSLEYLEEAVGAVPKNGVLALELGEEFPLVMSHDFADGTGTAVNLIAPRIQG